jgi:hypothetical protein
MKFEPADDIVQRHDEAAAQLTRAILLLRKIAQLRANLSSQRLGHHATDHARCNTTDIVDLLT